MPLTAVCVVPRGRGASMTTALYRSQTGGQTWTRLRYLPAASDRPYSAGLWPDQFQVSPASADRLFAEANSLHLQSRDAGTTWSTYSIPRYSIPPGPNRLIPHPIDPDTLLVFGTLIEPTRLTSSISYNNGAEWQTWLTPSAPCREDTFHFDMSIAVGPDSQIAVALPCPAQSDSGLEPSQLSTDGGASWSPTVAENGAVISQIETHSSRPDQFLAIGVLQGAPGQFPAHGLFTWSWQDPVWRELARLE